MTVDWAQERGNRWIARLDRNRDQIPTGQECQCDRDRGWYSRHVDERWSGLALAPPRAADGKGDRIAPASAIGMSWILGS